MKENETAEKKKTGELKAAPQKFIAEVIDRHLLPTEAYICSEKWKLQNNIKQLKYSEGRKEKNQNGVVRIKNRGNNFRYAQ